MTTINPDIENLLLRIGYKEENIRNIIKELEILSGDIGLDILEQKARAASGTKDATGLIIMLKEMMKLMENRGIYRPDHPTKLIKLLVNGLNLKNEDIFAVLEKSSLSGEEIRKEQEFLASCAAITQLGYILLSVATGEGKAACSGEHVFLLVDGFTPGSMIFVDFSIDSILEIDAGHYERDGNNYRLRAQVPDDETSKHIARYYSYFHVVSGTGLSHNIHNNIGIAYDKAGKHEEAFSEFNEALRLDPGYVEVFNNLAVTYHRMGFVDEAAEKLREAIRSRPGYAEAHCNMGKVYYEMGSYDRSAEAWIRAVYLDPGILEFVPEKLLLKVRRGVSRPG